MHIEEGTYGTLSQKRSSYLFCIYKKECVLVMFVNFGKDMTGKLRKKNAKTRILGLFSYLGNTCLGCGLKVLLRG